MFEYSGHDRFFGAFHEIIFECLFSFSFILPFCYCCCCYWGDGFRVSVSFFFFVRFNFRKLFLCTERHECALDPMLLLLSISICFIVRSRFFSLLICCVWLANWLLLLLLYSVSCLLCLLVFCLLFFLVETYKIVSYNSFESGNNFNANLFVSFIRVEQR